MASALEQKVLDVLATQGVAVSDRITLVNAVGGGSVDPFMIHGAVDNMIRQGKISTATVTVGTVSKPVLRKS